MEWRDVVGYEGIYEVSDTGLIRTHKDKVTHSTRHGVRHWEQRILKQKTSRDNTRRVSLYKNKQHSTWLVHRLVVIAFLPIQTGKNYVNHIDGNRLNNRLDNLEWCDHKENNNHAFDNGLIKTGRKIEVTDKETNKKIVFRSLSKASQHMGRAHGYLSYALKRGRTEDGKYRFKEIS